jgi:hypothetical protein
VILRWTLIGVAWLVFVGGALAYEYFGAQISVGAGYVAKEVCSCIHLGGRCLASCRPDVPAYMDGIVAEELSDGRGVRAFIPLFAERVARYEEGFGCALRD